MISWSSIKQKVVAHSLAESEYCALASVATGIKWISFLMIELGVKQQQSPLVYYDKVSAKYLAQNPIMHSSTNHIEIYIHFIRGHASPKKADDN